MIPNDSMANRLNAVKIGEEPPVVENNNNFVENILRTQRNIEERELSLGMTLIMGLVSIIDVLFASVLYGYAAKALLGMDWVMLEALGIGFVLNNIFSILPRLVIKTYNKFSKS